MARCKPSGLFTFLHFKPYRKQGGRVKEKRPSSSRPDVFVHLINVLLHAEIVYELVSTYVALELGFHTALVRNMSLHVFHSFVTTAAQVWAEDPLFDVNPVVGRLTRNYKNWKRPRKMV